MEDNGIVEGRKIKRKKRIVILLAVLAVVISLVLVLSLLEYIPLFTKTVEPVGNTGTMNVGSYIESNPDLSEIPNLDKLNYEGYYSTASLDDIVEGYKSDLQEKGYSLQYEGTMSFDSKQYTLIGFLKGLTAVGVFIYESASESEVIYVTGNALDFLEIIDWYQNK